MITGVSNEGIAPLGECKTKQINKANQLNIKQIFKKRDWMTKEHNCIYHYFSILYTKQFVIFKERKTEEKEKQKN